MAQPNLSNLNFDTSVNYMKQDPSSGTVTINLTSLGAHSSTTTITHSLGYVPFYQVLSEIDQNNTVWVPDKIEKFAFSSLSSTSAYPIIVHWVTTTTLSILVDNTAVNLTGNLPIYYLIYKDYGTTP